jgi:uncharacterized protein
MPNNSVPIRHIETVWITMPDGARLAARIWMPKNAEATPVPAILEYIPYRRRDRTRVRDEATHPRFAAAGYAAVRVDMRGSGDSDGVLHDEYLQQELDDACDVIAWIAAQPWCDGNVGMMGKSWGAYNSFQVAAMQPPALKAIVPVMGTDDRWAECIHFSGGVLLTDNFWWGVIMQLYNALPPDPEIVGERWREMWRERLDGMRFWPEKWLRHQTRDAQWTHGSVCEDYDAIKVPVYFFGGWADLFRDTPFRIAEHLRVPCKVMMGPWAHLYPHEGIPEPKVDFVAEALRWWDHWLKGIDTGIMDEPRLRFFMQDSAPPESFRKLRKGHWVEEAQWPSPNVKPRRLWLNAGSLASAAETVGAPMTVCSPQRYGAAAGDLCSFATEGDLPADCRIDAGGALGFRSTPLDASIDILGQTRLTLRLSADRPQAFVAAVLADEAPDGAQSLITRGFVNLNHRNGAKAPVPVVPGEEMEVSFLLHGMAWRVPAGHRLVLHISSTYWPICWPSPEPVTLALVPGRSVLELPLRVATGAPEPRPLPVPPAPLRRITKMRDGTLERGFSTDLKDGTISHRVYIEGGVFGPVGRIRLNDTGIELGDISERICAVGSTNPLTATMTMTQDSKLERSGWAVRIETSAGMTATATHFRLKAHVECWDGDTPFHRVNWSHEIPRNGM